MGEPIHVPGPPCSLCGQYEAVGSMQNLADYDTTRFCAFCGPAFLRALADALDGGEGAQPAREGDQGEGEAPAAAEPDQLETCPVCSAQVELANIPAHVEMHAAETSEPGDGSQPSPGSAHWSGAATVRRSTHGHRSPRGASGKPREGDGE